jgi:hypothetical protein
LKGVVLERKIGRKKKRFILMIKNSILICNENIEMKYLKEVLIDG